jgi:hypothetical protein
MQLSEGPQYNAKVPAHFLRSNPDLQNAAKETRCHILYLVHTGEINTCLTLQIQKRYLLVVEQKHRKVGNILRTTLDTVT